MGTMKGGSSGGKKSIRGWANSGSGPGRSEGNWGERNQGGYEDAHTAEIVVFSGAEALVGNGGRKTGTPGESKGKKDGRRVGK